MSRHRKLYHLVTGMIQDHEYLEDLNTNCRYGEEIHFPRHIVRDCHLLHILDSNTHRRRKAGVKRGRGCFFCRMLSL